MQRQFCEASEHVRTADLSDVRRAAQRSFHRTVCRFSRGLCSTSLIDMKISVTEQMKNSSRPKIPACPSKGRIPVRVLHVHLRARGDQQADVFFVPKSVGAVERRFTLG